MRAKSAPGLFLLTPLVSPSREGEQLHFDCLVMNKLPFGDDFRYVAVPPLEEPYIKPEVRCGGLALLAGTGLGAGTPFVRTIGGVACPSCNRTYSRRYRRVALLCWQVHSFESRHDSPCSPLIEEVGVKRGGGQATIVLGCTGHRLACLVANCTTERPT